MSGDGLMRGGASAGDPASTRKTLAGSLRSLVHTFAARLYLRWRQLREHRPRHDLWRIR